MIIRKPEISKINGEICVAARVEIQSDDYPYPEELWFKFPASCAEYVTDRADGFAAALLPLAMVLGEDLQIQGVLSPRLLRGLDEYQRIQTTWNGYLFDPIRIRCDQLRPMDPAESGRGVGCTFSGGVDSYHTMWNRLPQNEKVAENRLTHCLMINGFDPNSDLDNTGEFDELRQFYEPRLQRLGLELLIPRTNIMQFIDLYILKQSFGDILAATALILGRLFSVFYIASSYKFTDFFVDGSHPVMDNLICTETMDTVHDSPHLTRVEKTLALARWEETHSALRICFNKTSISEDGRSIVNCCRCEKCVRTMLSLDMAGALSSYSVFPNPLKRKHIRRSDYKYKGSVIFARDIIHYARIYKRNDIVFDVAWATGRSLILRFGGALIRRMLAPLTPESVKQKKAPATFTPGQKRMLAKNRKNSRPWSHP
jgi:hypothetical protein